MEGPLLASSVHSAQPPNSAHALRRETAKIVRSRIRRWLNGGVRGLWDEFVSAANSSQKPFSHSHLDPTRAANARRAKRAAEAGQYRKALQALSSEGLATPSEPTFQEMLDKHPRAPPPPPQPSPTPQPIAVKDQDVLKALRSFPGDSAPGPSRLSANHLKDAVLCRSADRGSRALRALTSIINLLSAGQLPPEVVPHLCGATLLASCKKGGGHRPIAVGEVIRRLTSKCLARAVSAEVVTTLSPLQLGVGVRAGCESIIHAVTATLQDPDIPDDSRWCLLLDFKNAFNSVSRQHIFTEVRSRFPGLSAWVECCYGAEPILHFGNYSIGSQCGVQQGDPLGPLAFALALHPIVEKIHVEVPSLHINSWYLDDGTLCGSPEDLAKALLIVEQEGPARGLHLNHAKSLIFVPPESSPTLNVLSPTIPVTSVGFELLGVPIGQVEFCEGVLLKRVDKIRISVDRLGDLEDSHIATLLLRSGLAFPKFSFCLRTCSPSKVRKGARAFDSLIRSAFSDICGGGLSDWAWSKASLPVSLGGIGLRTAALHASAAFLASSNSTLPLVSEIRGRPTSPPLSTLGAVADLAHAAGEPTWSSVEHITVPLRQKALSRLIDEATFSALIDSSPDIRSQALARSTALPHAGDWLHAVPSRALGLHIPHNEFSLCLRYWLGIHISDSASTCPSCGKEGMADIWGDHQIGCGGNSDRVSRHNAIRDVLFGAAQSAALAPKLEAPALIPGSDSRPGDVFIPNWLSGRPAALDVTVISTLQPLTIAGAATTPGHALQVAESRKIAAHMANCSDAGISFVPLAVESLGGWSKVGTQTVVRIGRLLASRSEASPSDAVRHLFQKLSISLWRGNAALILNRLPIIPPLIDGVV